MTEAVTNHFASLRGSVPTPQMLRGLLVLPTNRSGRWSVLIGSLSSMHHINKIPDMEVVKYIYSSTVLR